MFYNYWNYPLYVWNYIKRLFKGSRDNHKLFIDKWKYHEGSDMLLIKNKADLKKIENKEVKAFRMWWKDGSKSCWCAYHDGVSIWECVGKTHTAEVIIDTKYWKNET